MELVGVTKEGAEDRLRWKWMMLATAEQKSQKMKSKTKLELKYLSVNHTFKVNSTVIEHNAVQQCNVEEYDVFKSDHHRTQSKTANVSRYAFVGGSEYV